MIKLLSLAVFSFIALQGCEKYQVQDITTGNPVKDSQAPSSVITQDNQAESNTDLIIETLKNTTEKPTGLSANLFLATELIKSVTLNPGLFNSGSVKLVLNLPTSKQADFIINFKMLEPTELIAPYDQLPKSKLIHRSADQSAVLVSVQSLSLKIKGQLALALKVQATDQTIDKVETVFAMVTFNNSRQGQITQVIPVVAKTHQSELDQQWISTTQLWLFDWM